MRPTQTPIGLHLTRVARDVSRAFDDAMVRAGGSLPSWLIVLNLKVTAGTSQRRLAAKVGIREATLTHHLNAMESQGVITRERDPGNRRTHVVALTEAGEDLFVRLRGVAMEFDRQLRRGLTADQVAALAAALDQLSTNVNEAEVHDA